MGLAERRAIKTFSEGKYLQLKQEVDTAAGFEVTIEANWDSLAIEDCAPRKRSLAPKESTRIEQIVTVGL